MTSSIDPVATASRLAGRITGLDPGDPFVRYEATANEDGRIIEVVCTHYDYTVLGVRPTKLLLHLSPEMPLDEIVEEPVATASTVNNDLGSAADPLVGTAA